MDLVSVSGSQLFTVEPLIVFLTSSSKSKNSGRAVQRMLSRQEFATVQSRLSTVYLSASTVLSSLSLGTFLLRHPFKTWSREAKNTVCYKRKPKEYRLEWYHSIGNIITSCICGI